MPPRVAKRGAVKKTPPAKPKKAEAPTELDEAAAVAPADEAPADAVPEETVAVDEDASASEAAEGVEVAEEAVPAADGPEEGDSGEDEDMDDVEDDAEDDAEGGSDGEGAVQSEDPPQDGKLEDGASSDVKIKSEECKVENAVDPEIEGDSGESDNGEDDNNEMDPSSFLPGSEESRKQKEGEIFVGGLSKKVTEDDLIKVFSVIGEVQAARIARALPSNKSRGFGFIQYATIEHAKKALAEMKDGVEVLGKRVTVSASTANDILYVGNICITWSSDQVLETLKNLGVEHHNEVLLPNDPTNEGKNKGFAFITFSNHLAAMAAFQRLKSLDACFGCDKSAKVAFAHSMRNIELETSSQVKTVYVEGFPSSWDEEKLKDLGKAYGEVESVDVVRRVGRNKIKEFGFIAFNSHECALACVEGINKAEVVEGENKLSANLARFDRKRRNGGAENSDATENNDKKSKSNVKNAKAKKKQTKIDDKVARGKKTALEHSGGNKRKGKIDSEYRGPRAKRQRGRASHSSDLEPHAGLLPSGRHGGSARRSHWNQPDVFAVHAGGHADPYSYPGYATYPGYGGPHPYAGRAPYPPPRAYY